jgi:Protein of unknown function (DUF3078).
MKKLPFCLLFAASLLVCGSAYSQENDTKAETEDAEDEAPAPVVKPTSPWKTEFMLSANLLGVAVFNWVGAEPNKNFNATTRLKLTYAKKKDRFISETIYSVGFATQDDSSWQKNVDLFYTRNTYLHFIKGKWALAGIMDFTTQFFNGYLDKEVAGKEYKFKISSFMSPGFLMYGAGAAYVDDHFYAGLAPLGMSHFFILDKEISPAMYGVEADRSNEDFGALVRAGYNNTFFKKKLFVNLQTSVFKHYTSDYVYFSMNNMVGVKLLKWLSLNADCALLYNNQSTSLNLVSNNSTGIPTGISTGSPKLQTYISYGAGVMLMLPASKGKTK